MVNKFGSISDSSNSDILVRGRPGIGFKLTEKGDFYLENKRLCNIAIPVEDTDAISKKYYDHEMVCVLTQTNENIKKEKESVIRELSDISSQLNESIETVGKGVVTFGKLSKKSQFVLFATTHFIIV